MVFPSQLKPAAMGYCRSFISITAICCLLSLVCCFCGEYDSDDVDYMLRIGGFVTDDDEDEADEEEEAEEEENRGLSPEELRVLRVDVLEYDAVPTAASSSSSSACCICMEEIHKGDRCRLLPPCRHAFHLDCIDPWLVLVRYAGLLSSLAVTASQIYDIIHTHNTYAHT